jgi:hypothetical protein
MAIEFGPLFTGRLVYDEAWAALDDVRFDRIVQGFAQHYELHSDSANQFSFARGEGYLRLERRDAFGYVDGGTVARLGATPRNETVMEGGNIIIMPPRYGVLRFDFRIRVVLAFWAFALGSGFLFFGGDWLIWLIAFIAAFGATIALIKYSLKRKLKIWLARESWN